ncbi:MAG: hypothetical protein EOM37_06030 [Proteobacteria bacterium]|nr:hypothetical protein [Pseudomonadota bacterium]
MSNLETNIDPRYIKPNAWHQAQGWRRETLFSHHAKAISAIPPELWNVFRDLYAFRQQPYEIVGHLLSGQIVGRETDRFAVFSRLGLRAVHTVLYHLKDQQGPKGLDALDALLVRDRLVKIGKRVRQTGQPSPRIEAGLSFCAGVLAQIDNAFPGEVAIVTAQAYPLATAPRRLIASSAPCGKKRLTQEKLAL